MLDKFKEIENKVFTAPYKWLIKKGLIVSEKVFLTMLDLYGTSIEEYKGNPNWAGDDWWNKNVNVELFYIRTDIQE